MTDESSIVAGVGGALALGGLMYRIYHRVKSQQKINAALATMSRYNNELKKLGLTVSDATLQKAIKDEMGVKAPIALITDKKKARKWGVHNNAYFMPPTFIWKKDLEELGVKEPVDKTGLVVMSDNKSGSLPILAHELGHAKDYEEGNLSNPLVTAAISLGGLGLGVAAPHLLRSAVRFDNPYVGVAATTAAGIIPMALAAWWANKRRLGDERRASDKAKKALLNVGEKLGKAYELRKSDKLLNKAFSTYETVAANEYHNLGGATAQLAGANLLLGGLANAF